MGDERSELASRQQLVGIGGWLGFLVASLLALGPVFSVSTTLLEVNDTARMYPELANTYRWETAKTITWISVGVYCAFSVFAGAILLKRQTAITIPVVIVCMWIAGPLTSTWALSAIGDMSYSGLTGAEVGAALGQPIVWATIWTAYLLRSRRVKNTYFAGAGIRAMTASGWASLSRRTRQTTFFAVCWIVVSFFYFQLFEPWGSYLNDEETQNMWAIIVAPPLLLAIGLWAYQRLVEAPEKRD